MATFIKEQQKLFHLLEECNLFADVQHEETSDGLSDAAHVQASLILDLYQEQCELLDPLLPEICSMLFSHIRLLFPEGCQLNPTVVSRAFRCSRIFYSLCKVRGVKTTARFVPHEMSDWLCVLRFWLCIESSEQLQLSWECSFTVFTWLSVLAVSPFDLGSLASAHAIVADQSPTLWSHLCNKLLPSLNSSSPVRPAACLTLAKLLCRRDAFASTTGLGTETPMQWFLSKFQSTFSTNCSKESFLVCCFCYLSLSLSFASDMMIRRDSPFLPSPANYSSYRPVLNCCCHLTAMATVSSFHCCNCDHPSLTRL